MDGLEDPASPTPHSSWVEEPPEITGSDLGPGLGEILDDP